MKVFENKSTRNYNLGLSGTSRGTAPHVLPHVGLCHRQLGGADAHIRHLAHPRNFGLTGDISGQLFFCLIVNVCV